MKRKTSIVTFVTVAIIAVCIPTSVLFSDQNIIWKYTTGGSVEGTPAFADNRVFMGSRDGKMYCFNAGSGQKLWEFNAGQEIRTSPLAVNGKVFFGTHDRTFFALDAATGRKLWQVANNVYINSYYPLQVPAYADGKVYYGGNDGFLICLDEITGVKIWSFNTIGQMLSVPCVANNFVYFGAANKKVYCLNAQTGAKIWEAPTSSYPGGHSLVSGDKLYIGTADGTFYCFQAVTGAIDLRNRSRIPPTPAGKVLWTFNAGGSVNAKPILSGSTLYFCTAKGLVIALEAGTGKLFWKANLVNSLNSTPAFADGVLYVINNGNHTVYALDPLSGAEYWNFKRDYYLLGSPLVVNKRLYFGCMDKCIYCIDATVVKPIINY